MPLKDELVALELGFWKATGDPAYYREHMAADGLAVFAMGVMNRDAVIASTRGSDLAGWTDIEIAKPRMLPLTDGAAALVYEGSARRNGEPYVANCTTVYARRDGMWRMVLHQQSPVDDG
jgi:hypothetical protein